MEPLLKYASQDDDACFTLPIKPAATALGVSRRRLRILAPAGSIVPVEDGDSNRTRRHITKAGLAIVARSLSAELLAFAVEVEAFSPGW